MGIDYSVSDVFAFGYGSPHGDWWDASIVTQTSEEGKYRYSGCNLVIFKLSQNSLPAQSHVAFNAEQVVDVSSVGTGGRGFDHPGSVFGHPVAAFGFAGEELFVLVKGVHNLFGEGRRKEVDEVRSLLNAKVHK
jgi:hypothetical protein